MVSCPNVWKVENGITPSPPPDGMLVWNLTATHTVSHCHTTPCHPPPPAMVSMHAIGRSLGRRKPAMPTMARFFWHWKSGRRMGSCHATSQVMGGWAGRRHNAKMPGAQGMAWGCSVRLPPLGLALGEGNFHKSSLSPGSLLPAKASLPVNEWNFQTQCQVIKKLLFIFYWWPKAKGRHYQWNLSWNFLHPPVFPSINWNPPGSHLSEGNPVSSGEEIR